MMDEKVTIIIPVVRPEKAGRCLQAIQENAGVPSDRFKIDTRQDVGRIGCPRMVRMMANHNLTEEWPWVMFLGDDTIPQPGFLVEAFRAARKLQGGWGLVGLNDGFHNGNHLATHWMGHRDLLPHLGGEFFCTEYQHCYCDKELIERAQAMGRYIWAQDALLIHDHPILTGQPLDQHYTRVYSEKVRIKDLQTYTLRRLKGWQA